MSTPYLGEIRMFASSFAPKGWALCNGQLMAISENTALFSLLGTFYGGDGMTTFALPNLQGQVPVDAGVLEDGSEYVQGVSGGATSVTLTTAQLPAHRHAFVGAGGGDSSPAGALLATPSGDEIYTTGAITGALAGLQSTGGSQPHDNLMPYLCISFIIALQGIYPTRD